MKLSDGQEMQSLDQLQHQYKELLALDYKRQSELTHSKHEESKYPLINGNSQPLFQSFCNFDNPYLEPPSEITV